MPTYEYECRTCNHRFDERQSFSSEPVATCPLCMDGARRLFHAVPVVFKGSGFYVNDYGKGSSTDISGESHSAKRNEASGSADGASEGSPASKDVSKGSSESKSQAGSETATAASKSS